VTDQATFQLHNVKGVAVLQVAGEVDIANVDQFKQFLTDAAAADNGSLIVSLEKATYLDSHMLEALVEASKRLRTNRRRLLVIAPKATPAGHIMRLTSIELAIETFETLDDALQSVK